ncbi:MAG TPA: hypothetical protein VHC18_18335 [Amycolatopsis sp.]|jgi:hypothetical protein|nr:hypothetical protein [Amycolatopsis sp.]
MKAMAAAFLIVGLMLLGGGVAYGFVPVSVADGTACGSAFAKSSSTFDGLSDTGDELCAQARTAHRPGAVALLAAGGISLIGALILFMSAPLDVEPVGPATEPSDEPSAPTSPEPSGPFAG